MNPKPPSGMRDFLPEEVWKRQWVKDVIQTSFETHGFSPLETSSIENISTLFEKYGEEGNKLVFRILHRGESLQKALMNPTEGSLSDLGLRYDLTVPFSRVASSGSLPRFFRRYQIQPVWRADRPGKGRFREFTQCDVDIIGSKSILAEMEVCSAVSWALEELGIKNFTIHVNHREILNSILHLAEIKDEKTTLTLLDKMDKVGREVIEKEVGTTLMNLLSLDSNSLFELIDENGKRALEDIKTLMEVFGERVRFSPHLARGLDYYTGTLFEITVPDFSGSIGGGGRYDGLSKGIPSVGFSLGFERIFLILNERGLIPKCSKNPDLMLCWIPGEVSIKNVMEVSRVLRSNEIKVEVFPEEMKLSNQLKISNQKGFKFVGILGSKEMGENEILVKHFQTGIQKRFPLNSFSKKDFSFPTEILLQRVRETNAHLNASLERAIVVMKKEGNHPYGVKVQIPKGNTSPPKEVTEPLTVSFWGKFLRFLSLRRKK